MLRSNVLGRLHGWWLPPPVYLGTSGSPNLEIELVASERLCFCAYVSVRQSVVVVVVVPYELHE